MYKEVGKTKKKPFLAGFSLRNKQSSRGSAGIHNRFSLCQHFRTQQQQRWQKNTRKPPKNQMVRLQKQIETTFCNVSVELVPLKILEQVQPLVKEMYPGELKQNVPLGGRISYFVLSWEKLTKDQEILEIVKGYKIPLLKTLVQENIPLNIPLKKKVSQNKDQHAQNQFLSNLSNPLLVRN